MPATQDAGSALVGKALALQDEAATRLHSQRDDWNERALNLAVRRAVIGQIYDRLRRTRDTSPLTLGHVYDALLDRTVRLSRRGAMTIEANANHRKATGVYYTPPAIIDHLINAAMTPLLRDANDGTTITLLDPACGTGWFLLSAIDRFKTWNQTNNEGKRPKALKLHLIGADIDPVAVHVARLSLTLANNQPQFGGSPGLPITFEVISGDSLLGPEAADDGIDCPASFQPS